MSKDFHAACSIIQISEVQVVTPTYKNKEGKEITQKYKAGWERKQSDTECFSSSKSLNMHLTAKKRQNKECIYMLA